MQWSNQKINKSKNKTKFNVVVDKINEANAPVIGHKPILKIKYNKSTVKDMYPKSSTLTMKIIASRGMGKTIFLIAFLHSLINRGIENHKYIYIFCPTFDNQDQWRSSEFIGTSFSCLNEGKLLVFGDIESDTKGNKLIETLYVRGRHNKTGIIECEQFTQATGHIEKGNTDLFVVKPPFDESRAQYYHQKVMLTLTAKCILKLGLLTGEKAWQEDNPELRYLILNKFGDINMYCKYWVCLFEDGNYVIVEINCIGDNTKSNIDVGKSRLDVIPNDEEDDCKQCNKCKQCKQWELVNGIKRN